MLKPTQRRNVKRDTQKKFFLPERKGFENAEEKTATGSRGVSDPNHKGQQLLATKKEVKMHLSSERKHT